jgi:hypothetical protein
MTGSTAEQEYVWAHYEWMQLRANHTEAVAALQQINQLGEHINDGLLLKKKYLLTVVKAYERMAKKRVCVSASHIIIQRVWDNLHSHIAHKLLVEQQTRNPVVAEGPIPEPMARQRYDQILREMHESELKALQSAHDSALYEVQRLKQRQQSGTQQHLVVREKRELSSLIGKTQRARKLLVHKMIPHVRYIMEQTDNHNIPVEWKTLAMQGAPYWLEAGEESDVTPSTAEKNSIVESYLKRQRAWEQVTVILPRETVDAMSFFADLEKRSIALMEGMRSQLDGQPTSSREMNEYHLGCCMVCQDVSVKAREYRLICRDVWNRIESALQSAEVIEVTSNSGEAGRVPTSLKIHATLPILPLSRHPSEEILRDYMAEQNHLQTCDILDSYGLMFPV